MQQGVHGMHASPHDRCAAAQLFEETVLQDLWHAVVSEFGDQPPPVSSPLVIQSELHQRALGMVWAPCGTFHGCANRLLLCGYRSVDVRQSPTPHAHDGLESKDKLGTWWPALAMFAWLGVTNLDSRVVTGNYDHGRAAARR